MSKRYLQVITILFISLYLTGCAPAATQTVAPTLEPTASQTPAATQTPAPTATPTEAPFPELQEAVNIQLGEGYKIGNEGQLYDKDDVEVIPGLKFVKDKEWEWEWTHEYRGESVIDMGKIVDLESIKNDKEKPTEIINILGYTFTKGVGEREIFRDKETGGTMEVLTPAEAMQTILLDGSIDPDDSVAIENTTSSWGIDAMVNLQKSVTERYDDKSGAGTQLWFDYGGLHQVVWLDGHKDQGLALGWYQSFMPIWDPEKQDWTLTQSTLFATRTLADGPKSVEAGQGNGVIIFKDKTAQVRAILVAVPLTRAVYWSPYYADHSLFSDNLDFGK